MDRNRKDSWAEDKAACSGAAAEEAYAAVACVFGDVLVVEVPMTVAWTRKAVEVHYCLMNKTSQYLLLINVKG